MGCTSSAQNTLSPNASKQGNIMQLEEDADETYLKQVEAISTESENKTEMKVLPPSDTTEPAQIVRNYKSTTSLEPEKDLNTNGHKVETESSDTCETTKDDKLSKLKLEIVGKFIETAQQDTNHDKEVELNTHEAAESTEKDSERTDAKVESNENGGENETNLEETDEASPSSQSNRATRWEALADIAAELPSSLAVDTITGQIYSLSK